MGIDRQTPGVMKENGLHVLQRRSFLPMSFVVVVVNMHWGSSA